MIIWIKRCARILAISSFFIAFFLGLDPSDPFDKTALLMAFVKGCLGALMFWAVGYIIADIVIKGLVAGIPTHEEDAIEGGVLQRLYDFRSDLNPDSQGESAQAGAVGDKKKTNQKTL